MQLILFHLCLFTTIFSYGFAQEKSLYDSEDNILPSAEENHVQNPEDGVDASVNVEEILRELSAERAKNRDLNQTISDILDRIADMEKNIMRNEEKITENQSSVVLLTKDVEDLQEEVDGVQDDVASVQGDVASVQGDVVSVTEDVEKNSANITKVFEDVAAVQGDVAAVKGDVAAVQDDVVSVAEDVERNSAEITTLGVMGSWCAARTSYWSTGNIGTITYDSLTFSSSNNMNLAAIPLDINTGINRNTSSDILLSEY